MDVVRDVVVFGYSQWIEVVELRQGIECDVVVVMYDFWEVCFGIGWGISMCFIVEFFEC